jgi:hypothetical protein
VVRQRELVEPAATATVGLLELERAVRRDTPPVGTRPAEAPARAAPAALPPETAERPLNRS